MTSETQITKRYLTWGEISQLVDRLATQIDDDYDILLVVTRGGMIPACLLSERMDMRNIVVAAVQFYTGVGQTLDEPRFLQFPKPDLLEGKRVLVIDDVWDSGRTVVAVRERVRASGGEPSVAVLHFKPRNSHFPGDAPDFYVEETADWIVYPWDAER